MSIHRLGQIPFPEFETDSQIDRLTFMALPDRSTARRMIHITHMLKRKHGLRGKLFCPERLHVSLLHIRDYDEFPDSIADLAKRAAASIIFPPIEVVFDRAMSFFRQPCTGASRKRWSRGIDGVALDSCAGTGEGRNQVELQVTFQTASDIALQ